MKDLIDHSRKRGWVSYEEINTCLPDCYVDPDAIDVGREKNRHGLTANGHLASKGTGEGTEVEEGRKLLEESDVEIISAMDLTDAAKKVVQAASA